MKFVDEQTYENFSKRKQESLFHKKIYDAIQSLKKSFAILFKQIIFSIIYHRKMDM